MSEEQRARVARRVLYVANPGSESDEPSEDDRRRPLNGGPGYSSYRSIGNPTSYASFEVPRNYPPPSITTNFSSNNTQYPASYPQLSSPSSTSSPPAEESTPPPSTPAVPIPLIDLSEGTTSTPEMIMSSSGDRDMTDVPHPSATRLVKHFPPAKPAFGSRGPRIVDAAAKRPKTVSFFFHFTATTPSALPDTCICQSLPQCPLPIQMPRLPVPVLTPLLANGFSS